ncbi:similar to Saccharomyces cerevisiae YBL080C PET112 Subunit of the trimeric GatFAB AmidoTransferase(AdT) complex [Maudiozyma saulgeensis]|uniref:Glutamyl-tRNA(Gln) amidotransferase subunit B, mitochondrial n=1 Tax=Maudiozyma saulgeensis TaxID=1789683 RepID=A0A1X7R534_9SACH|nr:similar to Saccharomyces cerevisiae YBL080C PET112 Subunit of the trimeric GatFAB AmidoTransferase(AdT) complex [Kazachstania saulgeensis]
MLRLKSLIPLTIKRRISNGNPIEGFELTCGLEIHTQLNTTNKLFSRSVNNPFESISSPNVNTSYFDIALPGTQPILNYEAVLFALKLALSLNSTVNLSSQFDRKHYFYGDQPQGYQITQHYHPFSKGGYLRLSKEFDEIKELSKEIRITQLQIEQDTARSLYHQSSQQNSGEETLIDLNRSNVPLIELVTEPDFHDILQVKAFIKKYQNLVRQLKISTGDLEAGSIRIDVNVSVNEHPRVELKNLPNTSSIINAIKYEYERQVNVLKNNEQDSSTVVETRGWDGSKTTVLRSKESTMDYRYMADPELPPIALSSDVLSEVAKTLSKDADDCIRELMSNPYNLSKKDARIMTIQNDFNELYNNEELRVYYIDTFNAYKGSTEDNEISDPKIVVSWILHELLGNLKKLQIPLNQLSQNILSPKKLASFLNIVHGGVISNSNAKQLLFHILEEYKLGSCKEPKDIDFMILIKKYDLEVTKNIDYNTLEADCREIIETLNNPKMIESIKSGKKKNSIKYLVGLGMRKYQGKIQAQELETMFKKILNVK